MDLGVIGEWGGELFAVSFSLRLQFNPPDPQPFKLRFRFNGQQFQSFPLKFALNAPAGAIIPLADSERYSTNQIYLAFFDGVRTVITSLNITKSYGQTSEWSITAQGPAEDLSAIGSAELCRIAGGVRYSDGTEQMMTIISGAIEKSSVNQAANNFSVSASGTKRLVEFTTGTLVTVSSTPSAQGTTTGGGSLSPFVNLNPKPFYGAKTLAAPSKIMSISEEDGEIEQITCEPRMSIDIGDRLIFEDGRPLVVGSINYTVNPGNHTITISKLRLDDAYNKGGGTEYRIGDEYYQRVPWIRGTSTSESVGSGEYL